MWCYKFNSSRHFETSKHYVSTFSDECFGRKCRFSEIEVAICLTFFWTVSFTKMPDNKISFFSRDLKANFTAHLVQWLPSIPEAPVLIQSIQPSAICLSIFRPITLNQTTKIKNQEPDNFISFLGSWICISKQFSWKMLKLD